MTDDVRFSALRRKATCRLRSCRNWQRDGECCRAGCTPAQESERGAVVPLPSILAFDVNDSLLDIRTWRHCLNGCSATGSW